MSFDHEDLRESGRTLLPDTVALRRELHAHPELGLELPRTQQAVLDRLADLDLAVRTGASCTSVVADLVGDPDGPTVLLRGDMDALPMPEDNDLPFASEVAGTMHACGHDAHTAMLVGAARLLAERRDALSGTVRFMFQPGEEGHAGARHMIDEGVTDGVSRAFAIHVTPNLPSGWVSTRGGPMLASTDEFSIVVRGRGGHASTPHFANDPIPVACEVVTALQTYVTRRVDAFRPGVLTVTRIRAGTTTNVIPETALLQGTIRAVDPQTRAGVVAAVQRVATNIAAAHDMQAEVTLTEGYPVTVNDAARAAGTLEVATALLGPDRVLELPSPVMGAEDFSYVLQEVPGAMAFLGMCPPGADPRTVAPNHSNRMLIDEDAMATGIALYAAVALDALVDAGADRPS
jgi:hippurate hydrolase